MKKITIILISLLLIFFAGCQRNKIDDSQTQNTPESGLSRGLFVITDAVHDELSVLQVELTELKIIDTLRNVTVIFSENQGETFILNLLSLQDINMLLASVPLASGLYKELTLSYKNALALDDNCNRLTVLPQHFGTAKVLLNPYLKVDSDNAFIQIDFDLNNSVFNVVSGPHGNLLLMPTLIVKVTTDSDPEITEFKGVVQSVQSMSLVITHNDSTMNIALTNETVVEVDEIIVLPTSPDFDLTELISVGNTVEVDGILNVDTNTVTATRIERKFENHGLESQGIVVGLNTSSFNLLVLGSRDSGFEPGSVQTITYDDNTFFLYTDPCMSACADQLALGQDVRVTGMPADATVAQKVKLKETKIIGTVVAVNSLLEQISVNVAKIEGISVENIPGFNNPLTVDFVNEFPIDIKVGSVVELEGHFNRKTMGVFTAIDCELVSETDPDGEEAGDGSTWVGKIFSVISTSPLQISLTRGGEGGNIENRTVTVVTDSGTIIFEKYKNTTTMIDAESLAAGINSGRYRMLKAEGTYDNDNNTLSAKKIRADLNK